MVCKSWYNVFASNKPCLRGPQTPWLMLPEKKAERHHRRIFSLSKRDVLTNNLFIPQMSDMRCIGLNYGWVLTISPGEKGEMRLVHPLSRLQIELPPQTLFQEYEIWQRNWPYRIFMIRALSADPSASPSDFVLMIIHIRGKDLGYWRPGDKEWTRIQQMHDCLSDITYYQDQFYTIGLFGDVWSYKVLSQKPVVPHHVATVVSVITHSPYIVRNAGTLLVLLREVGVADWADRENGRWTFNLEYCVDDFEVYELDLIKGSYEQIMSIGDGAIFVGDNTSICFDHASQLSGVKSNHIYCTKDLYYFYTRKKVRGGKDVSSYHIQNGRTRAFEIKESSSLINRPFWFIPSL